MAILLIRHGETDLNASRVVQFPDTPLGATGLAQAERLGARLAAQPLALVLSSDYLRARTTAERVARAAGAPLEEDSAWRERHFGELRGRSYDTLGTLDILARDYEPPGGECWAEFDARVDRAWDALVARATGFDGDVAVVTHGLVLRSLLERRLDTSLHPGVAGLVVANTSVTTVDPLPPWRVRTLACVAHLERGAREVAPA